MDYSNERWVRLYTRDTATWKLVDWRARTVLLHILRKADRAGVIDVGKDGELGLAALLELPREIVADGLRQLLDRAAIAGEHAGVVDPDPLAQQAIERLAEAGSEAARLGLRRFGMRPEKKDSSFSISTFSCRSENESRSKLPLPMSFC